MWGPHKLHVYLLLTRERTKDELLLLLKVATLDLFIEGMSVE